MTIWVRFSQKNFEWTLIHGLALCKEYTNRYSCKCKLRKYKCVDCSFKKIHKCEKSLRWMKNNFPPCNEITKSPTATYSKIYPKNCTPVPLCIANKELHDENIVTAYRNYYLIEKTKFATWINEIPKWFIHIQNRKQISL